VRITLDSIACTGHGRCYALAPAVYDADDDGHCVLRHDGDAPAGLEAKARAGAINCPEDALTITD
jgi:ferredoxin